MEKGRKRKVSKASKSESQGWKEKHTHKKQALYIDATADTAVARLFDKCFEMVNDDRWKLPEGKSWFTEKAWKIDALQNLKSDLNETKSKLNDYNLTEWSRHTRQRNKAGQVQSQLRKEIRPEFLTQAWCKFYENACSFALIPEQSLAKKKLNSVHLCEAPGAFVAALNHWLKLNAPEINWNWLATTLNPHYEGNSLSRMINDDRLIAHTPENWYFGIDNTGNLMDLKNVDALIKKAGTTAMLVTADGSIDCLDSPAEQEQVVSQLHYCQVVAALHLLDKAGNFLLKVFTIFEHETICLIYLLSCCFEKVFVNKPVTSKEGNSEVYVVSLGFAGSDFLAPYMKILRGNYESPSEMAMFRKCDIPDSFIQQIVNCSEFFKAHQCEVILNNMRTFRRVYDYEYRVIDDVKNIKRMVAERFIRQYNLRPLLSERLEIVGKTKLAEHDSTMIIDFRAPLDSYNSRRKRANLTPKERLTIIIENLDLIELPDTGHTLKLNDIPDKLWISTGKPYTNIESSKFCTAAILKMYSSVLKIINEIGFTGTIPSSETIKEFNQQSAANRKLVNFGYTSIPDSYKLISQVCDALTNIELNETLTFVGYSLLSQLNVGILYVLARTFDSVELVPSEKLGCAIELKNYIKVKKITEILTEISNASVEAKREGQAILSVLPVSTLCDSTLYCEIVKINHWIIRHCVRNVFANFTE